MEIAFQSPVAGVVTEVHVRQGQQVSAGEVMLSIDPASEGGAESAVRATTRLALPEQRDPLALLFREHEGDSLAVPDLVAADRAVAEGRLGSRGGSAWRDAMEAVRDEIRRVMLGYDANPERCQSLLDFLDAPLPETLSRDAFLELAEIRHELIAFADVERLFIRAPRASVSGGLGPSNNARLRMYVRRMRAEGTGIAEEFLELVRNALSHYGVEDLTPTDALERAVLRLLSTQFHPELRHRLAMGMLRRITALAEDAGVDLADDHALADALDALMGMRGLLSDAMADAAIEARYLVFERREAERQAEQSSKALETWLDQAERAPHEAVRQRAPRSGGSGAAGLRSRRSLDQGARPRPSRHRAGRLRAACLRPRPAARAHVHQGRGHLDPLCGVSGQGPGARRHGGRDGDRRRGRAAVSHRRPTGGAGTEHLRPRAARSGDRRGRPRGRCRIPGPHAHRMRRPRALHPRPPPGGRSQRLQDLRRRPGRSRCRDSGVDPGPARRSLRSPSGDRGAHRPRALPGLRARADPQRGRHLLLPRARRGTSTATSASSCWGTPASGLPWPDRSSSTTSPPSNASSTAPHAACARPCASGIRGGRSSGTASRSSSRRRSTWTPRRPARWREGSRRPPGTWVSRRCSSA